MRRIAIPLILSGAILVAAAVWLVMRRGRHTKVQSPWTGPAVVYARNVPSDHWDILWQPLASGTARTVYSSARPTRAQSMPDEIGFLPSSDGRWLVVWETEFDQEYGNPLRTKWLVCGLPDGPSFRLGRTEGEARLLPAWEDESQLVLVGRGSEFRWKAGGGRPRGRLAIPINAEGKLARASWMSYCARYYPKAGSYMEAALGKLQRQVRLPIDRLIYQNQPAEYAVLRSSGLPGMHELRFLTPYDRQGEASRRFPYAAFSADGRLFAYAYVAPSRVEAEADPEQRSTAKGPFGASMRIYDLTSGKMLWQMYLVLSKVSYAP